MRLWFWEQGWKLSKGKAMYGQEEILVTLFLDLSVLYISDFIQDKLFSDTFKKENDKHQGICQTRIQQCCFRNILFSPNKSKMLYATVT